MIVAMGLLGINSVNEFDPSFLCAAEPVAPSHVMSAFSHLPDGRLVWRKHPTPFTLHPRPARGDMAPKEKHQPAD